MREKQLAQMRERNLYLEKSRHIEDYGEKFDWGQPAEDNSFSDDENKILSDDQRLLQEVYEILYTEKTTNGLQRL